MFHQILSKKCHKFKRCGYRLFSTQKGLHRPSIYPNDLKQFESLSSDILPKIKQHIKNNQNEDIPICTNKSFDELKSLLIHPQTLPNEAISYEDLLNEIDVILQHSPRSAKSRFVDKLYSGSDSITQFASLLLSVINNNTHTFKSAQILNVIENVTIKNLCQIFYKQDNNPFGGAFMPGGAYSNMMAIRLARDKYFPSISTHGLQNMDYCIPIILTSDQSHYSIMTAAAQVGIGTNNVIKLSTNQNGTIHIDSCYQVIDELIQNNKKPFIMCCTAGTTVLGAFDDLKALHEICTKYDIWMHVDGCWGGAAAFCRDNNSYLNGLVDGIELADSIAFDAHKLLSTGLLCGCLLVRDDAYLMESCKPPNAKYLFHGNEDKISYDIGLKTLQCGRISDALKLYLNWLYYGKKGLCDRVENGMNNARYLCQLIDESDDFILVQSPDFCNVCFWYVDEKMMGQVQKWKNCEFSESDTDIFDMLETNTKKIYEEMEKESSTLVDYSPCKNLPSFFRMITGNYRLSENDIQKILNDIRNAAKHL